MARRENFLAALTTLDISDIEAPRYFEFLNFINAPSDLKHLGAVIENVIAALEIPLLSEISINPDWLQKALKYRAIAYLLLEKINLRRDVEFLFRPLETNVKKVFHKYHTKHPKYVILFMNSAQNPRFYHQFHQITLFLSELVNFQKRYNDRVVLKDYEHRVLSEKFRNLSDSALVQSWYGSIKQSPCNSLYEMVQHFRSLEKNLALKQNRTVLYSVIELIRIIELALGVEKKRHSSHGGKIGSSGPHRSSEIDGYSALTGNMLVKMTLPDIKDEDDLIYASYEFPDQRVDFEVIASGEHLNEQEVGDVYIFQSTQPLHSYIQAFHGKRVSDAVLKRIVRQNNYLPLTLQTLSPSELQQLLFEIAKPATDTTSLYEQIVVLTMLFTASTFERARSLLIANKFIDLERPITIGYELSTHSWVIPALELDYRTSPLSSDWEQKPLLRLVASELCKLKFQQLQLKGTFSDTPKVMISEVNILHEAIRSRLNEITSTTITPGRVSNHLLVKCCAVFGQATSALLFCKDAPGSNARSYYTSLPAALLQRRYQQLLELSAKSVERIKDVTALPEQKGWLGARYRPDIEQIKQAALLMRQNLAALRLQLADSDNWIAFHNLYTTYQVFCQLILTGMRPILIPILQTEQLIKSVGVLVRKEKSKEDEFNTRHIPVCQIVVDFVNAYQSHIKVVQGRLIRLGIKPNTLPKLFYVNTPFKIREFQPSLYQLELSPYTPLPPNLNRRLLRNFLEEQGMSHEVIDVALGHANLGEQYWGAFSTLSLKDVRQQLQPQVQKLVELLELEVLSGLSA